MNDEIRKPCFDSRQNDVPLAVSDFFTRDNTQWEVMGSLSTLTYTTSPDPLFNTEKYTDFKCSISQCPKKQLKIYTPEDSVVLPGAISLSALYGIHVRKCGHKAATDGRAGGVTAAGGWGGGLHFDQTTLDIQANFEPPIRTSVVSASEAEQLQLCIHQYAA